MAFSSIMLYRVGVGPSDSVEHEAELFPKNLIIWDRKNYVKCFYGVN